MINNCDDIIDSRDIDKRIEELETELDYLEDGEELDEEDQEELDALKALQEEGQSYCPDWSHGATLIRDDYFEDYARETAIDIGAISNDAQWPTTCIDWTEAAEELQQDYSCVDFDGVEYWIR